MKIGIAGPVLSGPKVFAGLYRRMDPHSLPIFVEDKEFPNLSPFFMVLYYMGAYGLFISMMVGIWYLLPH